MPKIVKQDRMWSHKAESVCKIYWHLFIYKMKKLDGQRKRKLMEALSLIE